MQYLYFRFHPVVMKYCFWFLFLCIVINANSQTFREEEVAFKNGDVTLAGTLSFPEKETKKYKAIILVSGSGPQNRDSELLGFKPFILLADFFNKAGYAVLRYDDRGVGKSTGKSVNESTSADLAEDARQAFVYLTSRKDIDKKSIGLLGHSEGGIIVPMVAVKEEVSFIILMAGYGVTGVEVSNVQQAAILKSSGMSDAFVKASGTMNREIMRMIADNAITDEDIVVFTKAEAFKLIPLLPENIQAQIVDKEMYAGMTAQQVIAQRKNTWLRYYMNYDPLPTLKLVKCPVLMMFGELDMQVLPSQNSDVMKNALINAGNKQVEVITIPKANHLFQEAVTGSPTEYATLKKEFAPGFLEAIKGWLEK